jgi:N-acetylglucosamine-6-phosphate deacetylase
LRVAGALIDGLGDAFTDAENVDVSQCYVTPGLIDLQINGGAACDFWAQPDLLQVQKLSAELLQCGVTTFLPTLITADLDHIQATTAFLESIGVGADAGCDADFALIKSCQARLPGIHLEGPCLSPQRPGVHPPKCLQPLQIGVLEKIVRVSVKLMTLAPELDDTGKAIEYLTNHDVVVSLGHSNSTLAQANSAFDRGVKMVTHTYNAMPPLHHRAPGAVIASMLDNRVSNCVIADGLHVDAQAIKLLVKVKGVDKVVLVTDAAHIGTSEGGLVGSSISLSDAVRNMVNWQVSTFPEAIRMATLNPAACMGWSRKIGQLQSGNCADIVVWDKASLAIRKVYVSGELRYDGS